jgi:4-oxalocrotonate tautomerase
MPCLEITVPKLDRETKLNLSAKLTHAVVEATGFSRDILGILFREYDAGNAAIAGELLEDESTIPYLHFILYCPRLRKAAKRNVIKALTESFISCVGHPDWKPVIHIDEHPYDNVGIEGMTLSDRYEECAASEFYFHLPDD